MTGWRGGVRWWRSALWLTLAVMGFAGYAGVAWAGAEAPLAAEELLFCNEPERLSTRGVYAEKQLVAGRTYRIFFHYRNSTSVTRPLVVSFARDDRQTFSLDFRKGMAEPHRDPTIVGREAMARYLVTPTKNLPVPKGVARFPMPLKRLEVGSGVITVRADKDVRLQIYFADNRWTIPGSSVVSMPAPRREIEVNLTADSPRFYTRIGAPDADTPKGMDGTYGLFYEFKVNAPAGRKVRGVFSPRGGHSGMVGLMAGRVFQSNIVDATKWAVLGQVPVGPKGLTFHTAPFGGVFYPVTILFYLV